MSEERDNQTPDPEEPKPFFSEGATQPDTQSHTVGQKIGPFKVLGLLGEGGYGMVYMAQQDRPIKRRVALKVIKPGMDSREVIARFEAERQALALLDHANIARVFTAGTTEQGHPYFAMEYIEGLPITEYCDREKLNLKERLNLFVGVCAVIGHAHQKGIIHRDLKPSNILVATIDQKPAVKVIDFGIAKALSQSLTEKTIYTQQGHFVGTPDYMSPEQATMDAQGIDTRSDVYSLGVVLYELLTGVLPFDPEELRAGGIDHVRATIREQEPCTPSTRLTSLGKQLNQIAQRRRTDPKTLKRSLLRELEWIPLEAMRKESSRRYRSAAELSDDIHNYLCGVPLVAGPESTIYRMQKFTQRHTGAILTGLVIVVLILVGLTTTTLLYLRAEQSGQASAERAEAYRQALYRSAVARAYAEYQTGYAGNTRSLLESCPVDLRGWEWYYLNHVIDEARLTINGHNHTVTAVAFSPSGKQVASASMDKTIKIWDADTGSEIESLQGHDFWVNCMTFTYDGSRIISGSCDQSIKIWDVATGEELHSMSLKGVHKLDEVVSLAVSRDGNRIISGGCFGTVKIWDAIKGIEVKSWNGHTDYIHGLSFSPDNRQIVSGSRDKTVKIWDATDGHLIRTIQGYSGPVSTTLFNPNGKCVIAGDWNGHIKTWDVATGAELSSFRAHKGEITSTALTSDGKRLASASADCTIKIWDTSTNEELRVLHGHNEAIKSVAFSRDNRHLVSGSQDKTIKKWDTNVSHEKRILSGHEGHIQRITFSPDSQLLASCGNDKTIRIWSRKTGNEMMRLEGHNDIVNSVAFSPDGGRIVSSSWDKTIKIWDPMTGNELTTLYGHSDYVYMVVFTPDGNRIVSSSKDKSIRIWDVRTGEEEMIIRGHQHAVEAIAVSPNGEFIASGGWDKTVRIWDQETGSEITTLEGFKGQEVGITGITFSPNGKHIAFVGRTQELAVPQNPIAKIWDVANHRETMTLRGHSSSVNSVTFSPDGKRIVTASSDDTIRIWDAVTGHEILVLQMTGVSNPWMMPHVAYSPDGKTLAVSNYDKIRLFHSVGQD